MVWEIIPAFGWSHKISISTCFVDKLIPRSFSRILSLKLRLISSPTTLEHVCFVYDPVHAGYKWCRCWIFNNFYPAISSFHDQPVSAPFSYAARAKEDQNGERTSPNFSSENCLSDNNIQLINERYRLFHYFIFSQYWN